MKITVKLYFTAFESFSYHLFYSEALWEQLGARVWILTIEIMRAQTATIVSHNDSIRIEHWYNFENKTVSEGFCHRVLAKQELKQALHNKRAVALTWMHSTSQYHALSLRYVIL